MLGAMFLFSIQDVLTKTFSVYMSIFQIYFIRAFFGLIILSLWLLLTSKPLLYFKTSYPFLSLIRVILFCIAYPLFYIALSVMPIANAVTLFFVSPIFINIYSMIFYRTVIDYKQWLAIIIGFFGVYFVSNAKLNNFDIINLLPIFCAALYALSIMITNHTLEKDTVFQHMMHFHIGGIIFGGVLSLIFWSGDLEIISNPGLNLLTRPWVFQSLFDILYIFILALITTISFLMLFLAYKISIPLYIAPFEYSNIVWAILMGYFIWNDILSLENILGIFLISICGIFLLLNDKKNINFKK
jgi:drug/metabolite transporter (DMT)-like permease